MRENMGLFHGKRKDNEEWVCGDLVHSWENMNTKPDIQIHNNMGYFDVIPETVGEYTGLTDKNGKKIFEGDVVKVEGSRNVYEVRWNETLTGYWYYRSGCFFSMLTSNCEVIGTIYDVGGEK